MINPSHLGRKYGPYRYTVGLEKVREFALAVYGGTPSMSFPGERPAGIPAVYMDEEAGRASPHGAVIAPPTFCTNFAMRPFAAAIIDPALQVNLLMLVHGEQTFEWARPLRVGETVTTEGEITGIHEKGGKDFLEVTCTTRDAAGVEILKSIWTAVIRG